MSAKDSVEQEPWPFRVLLLLGLGMLAGLLVHLLLFDSGRWTETPLRLGLASFIGFGGLAFALSLERLRWTWSVGFALAVGLVLGLVVLANGFPGDWGPTEGWRFVAALLSAALALPLFQAVRDAGGRDLRPQAVHEHVWTDAIIWGLSCAFAMAVWLLANMLGALFDLIGIHFVERLIREDWFPPILIGGALGAALGMIRDRDIVLRLLQRVGRTILSVLAPVLAIGLLFFVLALPFTGLEPLWRETKETTPILLACMFGAFVLANAVIGHSAEEEARARPLRWAAMALGAVLMPLGIVAAISLGKRIAQYGFTPDRLWAAVVVFAAVAVAAAYLLSILWRRGDWAGQIRRSNVALAACVSLLALFLALPIVDFGAISARNQLAMLQSGRIAPDRFDWAAMRFDFGPSGRKALERLRDKGPEALRARAAAVLGARDRHGLESVDRSERQREALASIQVLPRPVPVPPGLSQALSDHNACRAGARCFLFFEQGAVSAVAVSGPECPERADTVHAREMCATDVTALRFTAEGWTPVEAILPSPRDGPAESEALRRNQVEIREVRRRQVFVGGRPVGKPFE